MAQQVTLTFPEDSDAEAFVKGLERGHMDGYKVRRGVGVTWEIRPVDSENKS